MRLILASQSASRRAMLAAAGVPHEAMAAAVDEESMKAGLRAEGVSPRNLADALAELKATKLSHRHPTDLVLGCDSTVAFEDGTMIDKAASREEQRDLLRRLSGTRHKLHSAAVICEGGVPVWRHVDSATLHVRALSDAFIDGYMEAEWPAIGHCVGGYRIEGLGAQLFARIEGSQFTILGLPLLPLLDYLRTRGVIES
ncbi:Maf family protein [Rhizorhabdus dicambivorans]|uniref:Nucleoside triphosphate pyrophosphatase n=2 Tax=Rhizorhabdus dicambivorans TaxID=1850238 RepID=A0A2A4G0G7_9SPHN|nr:nucleoside triphosphate pyrophosphatase [Rhizorhabdus dicambivorans]ATE63277.1 septum formation protein Maf [Rhizorhabdus dicambivorans]PCE43491.1 septum formation protein Maf [Rhizorhabdus dicambivorans]